MVFEWKAKMTTTLTFLKNLQKKLQFDDMSLTDIRALFDAVIEDFQIINEMLKDDA